MVTLTGQITQHHNISISTPQIVGAGDGLETDFNIQLDKFPIDIENVTIEWTIGATVKTTVSDSSGNFSHADLASGSIARDGSGSLSFNTAPDDATDIRALSWNALGLIEEIVSRLCPPRQIFNLGTGDGIETNFSVDLVTVGNIPFGQLRLLWIYQGVPKDVWDDGEGLFIHNDINTQTIVYDNSPNPSVDVTFNAPPDDGESIDIWLVDSSTNGQDWMELLEKRLVTDTSHNTESDNNGQLEVVIKNSGESNKEQIMIGLREYSNTGSSIFGLSLSLIDKWDHQDTIEGHYYNSDSNFYYVSYNTTNNEMNDSMKLVSTNDQMEYWIFTDKDFFIIVLKLAGTIYTHCYCGKTVSLASPSKYPRPYIVLASTEQFLSHSSNSLFGITRPKTESGIFIDKNGQYIEIKTNSGSQNKQSNHNRWINTGVIKKTLAGKVVLYPVYFFDEGFINDDTFRFLFSLKKVFICPDNSIESENTVNGGAYIIFQDVFRTSYIDYIAIEM